MKPRFKKSICSGSSSRAASRLAESKDKPADDAAAKDAAKKEQQESEDAMKKLAETLRARAAAGEDFAKAAGRGHRRVWIQRQASHQAGQGAAHQPAARSRRDFQPEARRDLAADHHAQRIPGVQGGRKRYFAAGPSAGGNLQPRCSRSACRMRCRTIQQSATPELNEKYFADAPADAPHGHAPPEAAQPAMKAPESGPK